MHWDYDYRNVIAQMQTLAEKVFNERLNVVDRGLIFVLNSSPTMRPLAHFALFRKAMTGGAAQVKTEARREADKLTCVVTECDEWEHQPPLPLAQARIKLDLNDGVKVNCLKLGEALASIAGLASKEGD